MISPSRRCPLDIGLLCRVAVLATVAAGGPALADPGHTAAQALADKFSGASVSAPAQDADARHKAEEAEMLERARKEAAEEAANQPPDVLPPPGTAEPASTSAEANAAQRREMEAARKAEADRLAEKLKRAEEARRAKLAAPAKPELPGRMGLGQAPPVKAAEPKRDATPHVTVLLVMEPGHKGIRRFNKTADPVLCSGARCFISTGPGSAARELPITRALGPGNTFGTRAGACRSSLTCVFRNLPLGATSAAIQPVDMKVMVHDRREIRSVKADASCRVRDKKLTCDTAVVAKGYRAWIVPEAVAEAVGPEGLKSALAGGLMAPKLLEARATTVSE